MDATVPSNSPSPSTTTSTPSSDSAPTQSSSSGTPAPASSAQSNTNNAGNIANKLAPNSSFSDQSTAPTTEAQKAEEKWKRKFKLKVDGQEYEEELDEVAITTRLQKAHAAEKRMQEAAESRKRQQQLIDLGKENFEEAAKALWGLDPRAHYEKMLADEYDRQLQEADMTPEQRALAEKERALAEREAEVKKWRDEREQEKQNAELTQQRQSEERYLSEALELSKLPKTHESLYYLAETASLNEEMGIELSPEQVANETRERLKSISNHVLDGFDNDDAGLVRWLGEKRIQQVRRFLVAQAKGIKQPAPVVAPREPEALAPGAKLTDDIAPKKMERKPDAVTSFRRFMRK
jgi:hypothetical protein